MHQVSDTMIEKMIVRKPKDWYGKTHPKVRKLINQTTQAPIPLTYKLQELPAPDTTFSTPIGVQEEIPFEVKRTINGNLPIYTKYKHGGSQKLTVIRHLFGDIDVFKQELSKIVSNNDIFEKNGYVQVKGIHKEKIDLWLRRLGF